MKEYNENGRRKGEQRVKVNNDEVSKNDFMQVERHGNIVSLKNTISQELHTEFMNQLKDGYFEFKESIDSLVEAIRLKIQICDPGQLLNCAASMSFMCMLNKTNELEYGMDDNIMIRTVEYIQSVIVSTEKKYKNVEEDNSEGYFEILGMISELYYKVQAFYIYWTAYIKSQQEEIDEKILEFIVEAQMMNNVRGKRYQVFQIEHLEKLLTPHNDILIELFNVSAENLIEGLVKLEYALSSEKIDVIEMMQKKFTSLSSSDMLEQPADNIQEMLGKLIGNDLYNVKKVTGWEEKLIKSLSYEINEYKDFYGHQDFSGWPILDLPIHKKPFIGIEGEYYCFDYYALFDNIYRTVQKTIKELKPEYVDTWSHIQQVASEKMVEEIFLKLLPGANSYRDNYYPKKTSLKDCAENDILIIYEDVLLIIEVKAGSFTYTPALTDYKAHIKSFKTLVEKADYQCERTLNYILSKSEVAIYDHDKNKKVDLRKNDLKEIYTICVTVDNFNEFAAKAEKLSFINLQKGTIALSVDDLRVYANFFESPLYFLHYLKHRKIATSISNIALNDELDHLGLYLKYNMYSLTAKDFGEENKIVFHGYREELDNYFGSLHTSKISFPKPTQDIPERMREIIKWLDINQAKDRVFLSSYLLDFCYEGRNEMCKGIEYTLNREKELGGMFPITTFGEIRYSINIYQPGIALLEHGEKVDYIYSTMIFNNEEHRLNIDLYYNDKAKLEKVEFKKYMFSDIPKDRYEELKEIGRQRAKGRVELHKLKSGGKKIGRNDMCPCGSGKKYKKCCIK